MDSNHRSIKQQIYSLSPLATRESSHIHFCAPAAGCLIIIAKRKAKCKHFFEKKSKKVKNNGMPFECSFGSRETPAAGESVREKYASGKGEGPRKGR